MRIIFTRHTTAKHTIWSDDAKMWISKIYSGHASIAQHTGSRGCRAKNTNWQQDFSSFTKHTPVHCAACREHRKDFAIEWKYTRINECHSRHRKKNCHFCLAVQWILWRKSLKWFVPRRSFKNEQQIHLIAMQSKVNR